MDMEKFETIIKIGETVAVEFKRCGGKVEADTYKTVCSFLNRFGGDIYLGVEDSGEVVGVPQHAVHEIIKNFISMVSNPDILAPNAYLAPEVLACNDKTVVRVHVPPSSEVHSYKKVIYDRVDDADVKVTATGQIAQMYIRKQRIFTEKKVYPYVRDEHMRLDLLPRIRQLAVNRYKDHPWKAMSDAELMQSTGLIGEDFETGAKGYNLAAVMLLGRDEVIKSVSPAYRTDALLRRVNTGRYDDRLIVETNLIDSYDRLMGFAAKHMLDKFYLESDVRVSLSSAIAREMLVNCLIHREFTSSYIAQFVIERDQMYTANANRAETGERITPDNARPNPKNPIIASFFRNIWLADELGSGVRNLYRYSKLYSGKEPQLIDGDVFRIVIPLDDAYSFDARIGQPQTAESNRNDYGLYCGINCTSTERIVLEYLAKNPMATHESIAIEIGKSLRTAQAIAKSLKDKGLLSRKGSRNNGCWVVKPEPVNAEERLS